MAIFQQLVSFQLTGPIYNLLAVGYFQNKQANPLDILLSIPFPGSCERDIHHIHFPINPGLVFYELRRHISGQSLQSRFRASHFLMICKSNGCVEDYNCINRGYCFIDLNTEAQRRHGGHRFDVRSEDVF